MSEHDGFGLLLTLIGFWIYGGYSFYRMLVKDKLIKKGVITAILVTAGWPIPLVVYTVILWSD